MDSKIDFNFEFGHGIMQTRARGPVSDFVESLKGIGCQGHEPIPSVFAIPPRGRARFQI